LILSFDCLLHNSLLTCYFSIEFNIGKQMETTFITNEQYMHFQVTV